jgi:hypothetical protein
VSVSIERKKAGTKTGLSLHVNPEGSTEVSIHDFTARDARHSRSIAGLFWLLPEAQQVERIRQLSRTFSAECISTITRKPVREVVAIIEGAA